MKNIATIIGSLALAAAGAAHAAVSAAPPATYYFVDWTTADPAAGTASGTITLPDLSTVGVSFEVMQSNGSPGSYYFANTNGGTNYWSPTTPYISNQVGNAPPDADIIALTGGNTTTTYTIRLSEAIKDPIMDIVSLGQSGYNVTYDFNRPFAIVSQGAGYWGGSATALQQLPGDILQGAEGHGTIQFIGSFDSFSWTAPVAETWHGFQFGIRTTERLEPMAPVPEPGTFAMFAAGVTALVAIRRRAAGARSAK